MEIDVRLLAPLATLLAIAVSTYWIWYQRFKALSYEIQVHESLVSLAGPAREHIELSFDGKKVRSASLVFLKLSNCGHTPINPSEYQARLTISFNSACRILCADIKETAPADLELRFRQDEVGKGLIESISDTQVTLRPLLLNPAEFITLQIFVQDLVGTINVGGHIQGIRTFKRVKAGSFVPVLLTQLGALIMCAAMLGVDSEAVVTFGIEDVLPYALIFLTGYVILCAGNYLPKRRTWMQERL